MISHAAPRSGVSVGIGLILDNGVVAVACELAALWTGNYFVPLDLAQPQLAAMLERSGIEVVFCSQHLAAEVAKVSEEKPGRLVVLSIGDAELTDPTQALSCMSGASAAVTTARAAPHQDHVCIFHTSGTTGVPKPIHDTPEQWCAFAAAAVQAYHMTSAARVFVATSAIFDPSAGLTFAALSIGATICFAPWSFALAHLRESIELTRATHACSTPSVWALHDLASEPKEEAKGTLTTVMLGGEPMPAPLIRTWLGRGVTLINTYGTTEATVYQFAYELPPRVASLTDAELARHARCLGAPFDGIGFAVTHAPSLLDELMTAEGKGKGGLQQEGGGEDQCGELVLWGAQVGGPEPSGEERVLHTGDLVSRSGDTGELFYLGRADQQVKLNGRRIELGPIGTTICAAMHPLVRRAVVLLLDGRLHAFCAMGAAAAPLNAASPGYAATAAAVRVVCGLELPPYLVPHDVTLLGELPMTPTGKTDARALAELGCVASRGEATAEVAEREAEGEGEGAVGAKGDAAWQPQGWLGVVAECWSLELGIPVAQLSPSSNFCALSGDSLVALKICARLWRRAASDLHGGTFGESMGAFGPVHLLATPVLSEHAATLEAAVAGGEASCGEGAAAKAAAAQATTRPSELDAAAEQAVTAGSHALLEVLLRQYKPRVPLPVANSLLLVAVRSSQPGCTALMLRYGASSNATSAAGAITALHVAVQLNEMAIVHLLLDAGADVTAVDHNHQTALHHAARAGADLGCFEVLLGRWDACGGDVTATGALDVWGRTALHWATINGHREAAVALAEAGSDISLLDLQNESALDLAEKRALCNAMNGKCDRLTAQLLRLMLPADHPEYCSFHPTGFLDVCTAEALGHAARLRSAQEALAAA